MESATEITIIGGGVTGASIAFHLARMGCRDVTIIEKENIGSGATGKCAGGIRQQFSTEVNIGLSLESVRFFDRFEEYTGYPADFRQYGYLILATSEPELHELQSSHELQKQMGVESRLLSPADVKHIVPQLNTDDILGASFCPTDGYADPYAVVQGFAAAAREAGVQILRGTEVTGILLREGRVTRVETDRGPIETTVVVNAAGAYGGRVAAMAGAALPVRSFKRHVFVTAPNDTLRKDCPMVVELMSGFWFRREGPALIFGMRNPSQLEGFDQSIDWGYLAVVGEKASRRLPFLEDVGIGRAQAGLHADTPDFHAILGPDQHVRGLFHACGFSGHGFMHSPAVGRIIAELILKGTTTMDITSLQPGRFGSSAGTREQIFI